MDDAAKRSIAGALCGFTECLAVQPFDMMKTRFQLTAGTNPSLVTAFGNIYREGGIARFYRGMMPEMVSMVPKNAAMFASYDWSRVQLEQQLGGSGLGVEFLAGACCSVPEAITVTPFQVVKVRLQAKEHLARYRNTGHAVVSILRDEGPQAFFAGLSVTIARNTVWNSVYFPTMFSIKNYVLPETKGEGLVHSLTTLGSGFVGGSFATCFNAPFDVTKSRIQSQVKGQPQKYKSIIPSLMLIAREEGMPALYKGFAPKVIRMGIGGGVSMTTFDFFLRIMNVSR